MQTADTKKTEKVIVGLGQTGLSFARYLHSKHENFRIVDSRQSPPGLKELRKHFPEIKIELGEFQIGTLLNAEQLLVSPGVDLREPALADAIKNSVPVYSDIHIFAQKIAAPIVAVTGSNAKSTVVSLLGAMAENAGINVAVAGNIGKPVLDLLAEQSRELYVLEISSFQLESTSALGAEVACVLNISADHMDRYDSMQAYHEAKHRIFQNCKQVVINRDDPLSRPLVPASVKQWRYGLDAGDINEFGLLDRDGESYLAFDRQPLIPCREVKIKGRHNHANALAALALGKAVGLNMDAMLQTLREFPGLPHRCQHVAEKHGVHYYNDSKGTNVGACIAALEGLGGDRNVVLLAGGQGKGADFSELLGSVSKHTKLLILFGEDAGLISDAIAGAVPVKQVGSLEQAVSLASTSAEAGDIVLLSPACASFDMFKNYENRGEVFMGVVEALH